MDPANTDSAPVKVPPKLETEPGLSPNPSAPTAPAQKGPGLWRVLVAGGLMAMTVILGLLALFLEPTPFMVLGLVCLLIPVTVVCYLLLRRS